MGLDEDDELAGKVRQWRRRRELAKHEGERSLAHNLAWVGTLGWLITVPMVAGVFLGRWLDHRAGTGVVFAAALSVVGLGAGCWLAWRKVHTR